MSEPRFCNDCIEHSITLCDYCQYANKNRKFTGHCRKHDKPVEASDGCDDYVCFDLPPVAEPAPVKVGGVSCRGVWFDELANLPSAGARESE